MCDKMRPNAKAIIDNLKKHIPFGKKVGLLIKNSAIKLVKFQTCCGHPGEPGC